VVAPEAACTNAVARVGAIDAMHWLSAGATSFFRGLNDTPKIVALGIASSASMFPLAAVAMGLGSLLATLVVRQEEELRPIFDIPDTHAIAAVVAIGKPRKMITKLSRRPVEEFARIDRFDGPPLVP